MSHDKYISELTPKASSEITGDYLFVIQEPEGQANSTYNITVSEVVDWIQTNTNYTEIYSLPIEEVSIVGDTKITVLSDEDSPAGSPIARSEAIRIKASNKNVGLKTDDPQSTLEIWSSDAVNGDLMITPESGDRMGLHVSASDDVSSPTSKAFLHLGRKIFGEDSDFVPLVSIEESGNIEFGVNDSASVITSNGYSKFGAASPEIKMISLSGTVGTTDSSPDDSITSVAHGLDYSKIISCNVLVKDSSNNWIPPNDRIYDSKLFSFTIDDTNLNIILESGSPSRSIDLESGDYVCTIFYIK